ncbi:Fe-S cluster assembly protein SufD [Hirschia baltica]|uniref:SufBD protein n=1 Tax=Hirschia baltica (strain ATCC 49814 / DSM 5838 / IFAM 1418) TaxID=582402 RepID=C6XJ40_HIRBI|nr:Fe-S cluster assembly protein SufD [Hirschia baltica]ACT59135.1 SufBD protein [Hirschia baltica ATCC 49814]
MSEQAVSTLIENPSPAEGRFIETFQGLKSDARRTRAFEAFAEKGLPHRRVEGWRWSDLRAALKPVEAAVDLSIKDVFADVDAPVFRFTRNGLEAPAKRPAGVRWTENIDAPAFAAAEELPMGALASALATGPSVLTIEIGAKLSSPLRIIVDADAKDCYAHVEVLLREGASATIVETHLNQGGFSSVVLEYNLEKGAKVDRVIYQSAGVDAVQIVSANVHLYEGTKFNQTAYATGSKLCRIETRLIHREPDAEAILNAAYLLDDKRHADFTSFVRHSAGHCVTSQVTKGAVKKGGKGAYQGKFYVARDAQKTDASMAHNTLLLEDGAEVNAKPELEIYADDVQCAHGNTAGALDAEALFYMRQRGIPLITAKAMLTQSFIAEAFADINDDGLRDTLEEEARQWLMKSL